MTYNHKYNMSLIEQAKSEGKVVKTTTIHIDEIQRKQAKSGAIVITLVAKEGGTKFSAFERVWDAQNINIAQLEEGDALDVTYTTNGDYKNFLQVVVPDVEKMPF